MGVRGEVDRTGDQAVTGTRRAGARWPGMRNPIFACALLALVGACSSPEPAPSANIAETAPAGTAAEAAPAVAATSAAATANAATIGGDGSAIELAPLRADDTAELAGELACSFAADGAKAALLVARADVVDDAQGRAVIRIGDYTETLATRATGGFNAMEKGGVFAGRGMTLTLRRETRVPGAGEAVLYRATLRAQRADGAERVYPGLWTCGP